VGSLGGAGPECGHRGDVDHRLGFRSRIVRVCAVLAWSRFRFVRFADNQKAGTTFALLAECFETLGGVPALVLADRMGCLKAGVVANVVVPTPEYVRFATHYGFRPDFCEAADPESKGMVEHLVGYAKRDVIPPQAPFDDLAAGNAAAGSPRQMKKTSPRFVQRPTLEP
jgi:transposase